VKRKISDFGARGTPGYRRGMAGILQAKKLDILWIWELFGSVIRFKS